MNTFIKFNDKVIAVTKFIAGLAFVIMVISSSAQVVCRFVLNMPLPWSEELSRYTFVWSTMLGIAIYMRGRKHSSVDVLEKMLSESARRRLLIVNDLLCEVFFLIMIYGGFKIVHVTMRQFSPALNVRMGYMYLSVPVSGIIMFLMSAENLAKIFTKGTEK
ncbi:MAG: TRAP transporter small permease [Pyramidobacter sp.]|jgi:TRAP-type C4-dicarboxylate transport system permease small subunit